MNQFALIVLAVATTLFTLLLAWAAMGRKSRVSLRAEALLAESAGLTRQAVAIGRRSQKLSANPRTQEKLKRQTMDGRAGRMKRWDSMRSQLDLAGVSLTVRDYWLLSVTAALFALSGWMALRLPGFALPAVFLVFAFGAPRMILSMMARRRQARFSQDFADAVDVIVRGVRSGLPLGECLNIVARESAQPVRGLFEDLVESQRVGLPLKIALDRLVERMPTAEARFFAAILNIQQQTGGNLGETLSNLSGILRMRKKMREKVKAMSAEARMSAGIIGALPFFVGMALFLLNPAYVSKLWLTGEGRMMLVAAALSMGMGFAVMRKMIRFEV